MGADVDDLGRAFEIPGRDPPLTLTSGSSRASALSDGEPLFPEDTRLALFFVVLESTSNLRPSPRSLSNFASGTYTIQHDCVISEMSSTHQILLLLLEVQHEHVQLCLLAKAVSPGVKSLAACCSKDRHFPLQRSSAAPEVTDLSVKMSTNGHRRVKLRLPCHMLTIPDKTGPHQQQRSGCS